MIALETTEMIGRETMEMILETTEMTGRELRK